MDETTKKKRRTVLSWSSGKDCSYALHVLRTSPAFRDTYEVVGLLTTVNETTTPNRVAMHGSRDSLVRLQAERASLPPPAPPLQLFVVPLPSPCSNAIYEERMGGIVRRLKDEEGVETIAFGDIHLEDVKKYREAKMEGSGLSCVFPLWGRPTGELAREMVASGLRATLVCVDPRRLPASFAGRTFDQKLLEDLARLREEQEAKKEEAAAGAAASSGADPPPPPPPLDDCGENGEFHTFCWDGPALSAPIEVDVAPEPVELNGFVFCDVCEAGVMTPGDFRKAAAAAKSEAELKAEAMRAARESEECPVVVARRRGEDEEKEKGEKEQQAAAAEEEGGGGGGGGGGGTGGGA